MYYGSGTVDMYLVGSWRTPRHMQQWAAGRRHGRHLESMYDVIWKNQFCQL